jgi:hypothetical protein
MALLLFAAHCADDDAKVDAPIDAGAIDPSQQDGSPSSGSPPVDILFVVDNSHAMGAKQVAVANALGPLFTSLASDDIHVAVVSSSLGNVGDFCTRPLDDDKAHLINRTSQMPGAPIVTGTENGFLAFGQNGSKADTAILAQRAAALIQGAGQNGCGMESTLEAMYRFVAMPDPPLSVTIDSSSLPVATGVDYSLLAQRRAFFRNDSTVVIVLVTDGDDASTDLFSAGGFGHSFFSIQFPRSKVMRGTTLARGTTAARATSACATHPDDPNCTSCAFAATCEPSTPACQKIHADGACTTAPAGGPTGPGYDGFYAPADDEYNVRTFDMKRRFGVDALYPISRYVAALTELELPDRAAEHPESNATGKRVIGAYAQAKTCSNPLFSSGLPMREGDELCKLGAGKRSAQQVIVGVIAGIGGVDLARTVSWSKLLGDPHMLPSIEPRAGLNGADLPLGNNGSDPIHGREWRTDKKDLQFACTFPLQTNIDCSLAAQYESCDCPPAGFSNPPLCTGAKGETQTRGGAQPSVRELLVARALGAQAVLSSVCSDADGYRDFAQALTQRINAVKKAP